MFTFCDILLSISWTLLAGGIFTNSMHSLHGCNAAILSSERYSTFFAAANGRE